MEIIYQETKTLKVKDNKQSADGISPNYVYGCLGGCMKTYCYVNRYNAHKVYVNKNVDEIHNAVEKWVEKKPWHKIPNQQDPLYYVVDIGCNTDIALHQKYLKQTMFIMDILDFYTSHPKLRPSFATKYPNRLLDLQADGFDKKPRVRVSLMPNLYQCDLEPNTDRIIDRLEAINILYHNGWEVHVNFSPVVMFHSQVGRLAYLDLFRDMKAMIEPDVLSSLKYEVIFLTTHPNTLNGAMQRMNSSMYETFKQATKSITEFKPSGVMRYPIAEKNMLIEDFKFMFKKELGDLSSIRYIF
jgi:spore photoproduct lyase